MLFHHVQSKQLYLGSHGCYIGFLESLDFWLLGTLVNFPLIKSKHHRNAWFGPLLSRLTGQNFINVALKLKKLWPFENGTSITLKFWYSCINSLQQPHTALQGSEWQTNCAIWFVWSMSTFWYHKIISKKNSQFLTWLTDSCRVT